jgi:hypothetical protein
LPEYRSHTNQSENPTSIENNITKRPKATIPEGKKQPSFVPKSSKERSGHCYPATGHSRPDEVRIKRAVKQEE